MSHTYQVEFDDSKGKAKRECFGPDRRAALAYARKRSSSPKNAYAYVLIYEDARNIKAVGHISYSAGYRADTDGDWNP